MKVHGTMIKTDIISNLSRLSDINHFAEKIYKSNSQNSPKYFMNLYDDEVQLFLRSLGDYNVRYMLVGGVATVFHGHVRTTQDLDLWIQDTKENRDNLIKALKSINIPGAEHYQKVEMIPGWSTIKIGEKGFVADLMSYLKKFGPEQFDLCYNRSVKTTFEGIPITIISREDLIAEKKMVARNKDLDDIENLEKIYHKKKGKDQGMSM